MCTCHTCIRLYNNCILQKERKREEEKEKKERKTKQDMNKAGDSEAEDSREEEADEEEEDEEGEEEEKSGLYYTHFIYQLMNYYMYYLLAVHEVMMNVSVYSQILMQ